MTRVSTPSRQPPHTPAAAAFPGRSAGLIASDVRYISGDPKNAHLGRLEGALENLRLFKADVLDQNALAAAVSGCQGVFHLACPVPTDKVLDPEASASTTWFIALTFFFARGSLLNLAL